jgi:SAM-dependent methyltransferase
LNEKYVKLSKSKLIEEINVLGPWVHGHFDLGNGLVIEDQDKLQKKRSINLKKIFVKIIEKKYNKKKIKEKTLIDIGCNTGYFMFELYNKFNFKYVLGLEPRESNLKKARLISNWFNLSNNKFRLKKFDILSDEIKQKADIVLFVGVLHHLDDHLKALKNVYRMTKEVAIIETVVLSDKFDIKGIASQLELKDDLYKIKKNKEKVGIVGYKLETDRLDGATVHTGIVGIPNSEALLMMLQHVGFNHTTIIKSETQLRKEIFKEKSYREYHSVVIACYKKEEENTRTVDELLNEIELQRFLTHIPMKYIEPLYNVIIGNENKKNVNEITKLILNSQLFYTEKKGIFAQKKLEQKIGNTPYFEIINSIKHAPKQKISFEYAKTCYHKGKKDIALVVCQEIIKEINLDWRIVYQTYYLLAKINFELRKKNISKHYNNLSLRAHPKYSLAKILKSKLF